MLKKCNICGLEYPATPEYFYRHKDAKDGLRKECKACHNKKKAEYREKNREIINEKMREYRSKHIERVREQRRRYYHKHKDEIAKERKEKYPQIREQHLERCRKYYLKNREKILKWDSEYARENREKLREYEKKYYHTNKEKIRQKRNRRRSRKNKLPATLTSEQWNIIKEFFNNKCAYCGAEAELEQEHFIPLVKGGGYTPNNIIPACRSCNASKNNKDFFDWYPKQDFYSKEREYKILTYLEYNGANIMKALTN